MTGKQRRRLNTLRENRRLLRAYRRGERPDTNSWVRWWVYKAFPTSLTSECGRYEGVRFIQ